MTVIFAHFHSYSPGAQSKTYGLESGRDSPGTPHVPVVRSGSLQHTEAKPVFLKNVSPKGLSTEHFPCLTSGWVLHGERSWDVSHWVMRMYKTIDFKLS